MFTVFHGSHIGRKDFESPSSMDSHFFLKRVLNRRPRASRKRYGWWVGVVLEKMVMMVRGTRYMRGGGGLWPGRIARAVVVSVVGANQGWKYLVNDDRCRGIRGRKQDAHHKWKEVHCSG